MAQSEVLRDVSQLENAGRFQEAARRLIAAIGSQKLPPEEMRRLGYEHELLDRIRRDYSLTREDLLGELTNSVRNLTVGEFEQWISAGWFDAREIDGTLRFFSSSVSNLLFRHPELNARRLHPADAAPKERMILENVRMIQNAARAERTPYVLPRRFHVTMRVIAKPNVAPAGETIRAWLPVPRLYPFQTDFKLLPGPLPARSLSPEDSAVRSVYFEQPARTNEPAEFRLDYEFTTRGVSFDLDPVKIRACDTNDPALQPFLAEAPHVVFMPRIRELSARIVGPETNPLLKAKRIYDWLAENLLYSYAREYSTIANLSDDCRANGYGDCGQQALLFITLCRCHGVPARWQSGWNLLPNATAIHDWAEIYLAPYGWMPVDPYMGNYAMRYTTSLTDAQKRQIRDFYFGGLDHYRMAANADHSVPLDPPKQSFRSDDVDFQRGELEAGGRNIYFGNYSHHLEWREITAP